MKKAPTGSLAAQAPDSYARCAICNEYASHPLLEIRIPDRFETRCGVGAEGYSRVWAECPGCLTVTNCLPAESASKLQALRSSYYEVDFANSDILEKYNKVMALPEHQSDNAGRVSRVLGFYNHWKNSETQNRALDIGAGTGVFLSKLIEKSEGQWECVALEPDPIAANHLRDIGKFKVIEALYEGQPELMNFSLVTLNKVLEHIADPVPFLKLVSRSLSENRGILYVEVPDKLTIGNRPPEDNILGALHCHLYCIESLGNLFKLAGLEALRLERVLEPSGKITVFGFAVRPGTLGKL